MKLSDLPKFKDVRKSLTRHKSKRYIDYGVKSKTDIAIHHSLTKTGSAEAFARYHVNSLGWPGIGYHFVIEKDGTIKYCNSLGLKTYHVGNSNRFALGICLTGDFRYEEPTAAQKDSLRKLVAVLIDLLPNLKRIRGHNEFPGYAWKQCPEFDYKKVLGMSSIYDIPNKNDLWKGTVKSGGSSSSSSGLPGGILKRGSKGSAVKKVQEALLKVGEKLPKYGADGHYGAETEAAVKSFQKKNGLVVDGIYGPKTKAALEKALSKKKIVEENKPSITLPSGILKKGSKGSAVKTLQKALIMAGEKLPKYGADGVFGAETEKAVKSFQKKKKLVVDGIYGPKTKAALEKVIK